MTHQKYLNKLITFDIETTTFKAGDGTYTDVYLSSALEFYFDLNITKSKLNKMLVKYQRSWSDIEKYFKELSVRIPEGYTQIVYCHNLAYEIDGIFKNIDFFRDMFINDPENCETLFIKERKPVFVRFGNIEFRCSFKLLNKNLRALGELYDYPKQSIDYDKKYFSFSDLPDDEYYYNAQDVKLTAYAIIQECKKYNFIKYVSDIPLTSTSFVRQQNIHLNDKKTVKAFKNRNKWSLETYKDNIELLEQVYQGGYTHSNAFDTGRIRMNITSIDIISSYPDSIIHREYPYNFKRARNKDVTSFFKFLNSYNQIDLKTLLNNVQRPFKYAFYGKFKIRNVKIKRFIDCDFPIISYSKVLNKPLCTFDNGRIIYADEIEIYFNNIDIYLLYQFYDFELVEVSDFFYTRQFRKMHPFIINAIEHYANEKTVFKSCHKIVDSENPKRRKLTEKDFFCKKTNDFIIGEKERKNILKMNLSSQELTITILLQNAKAKLNSIYGIMVQRLYQDEYKYIIDDDDFTHEIDTSLPRNLYRNFEEGLYITSYSRLTLFSMAMFLLNRNLRPIYSDTDSWKVQGNPEDVKKAVEDFNKTIENSSHNSELYNIGYFDFETTYTYFISWGAKKYISIENIDGELKVFPTIAGVPKVKIGEAFTELLNKFFDGDIIDFVENVFKPNTVYRYSAIEKLSAKYYQDSFDGLVTDENGKIGHVVFNNMVELYKTDYCLLDTTNKVNAQYIKYLEFLQNRTINTDCSELSKENGEYKIQYIPFNETSYYLKSDYMQTLEEFEGR